MQITRKALSREAIEWTGTNLLEIQQFMLPHSPMFQFFSGDTEAKKTMAIYGKPHDGLSIMVRDMDNEARYTTLGPQYKQVTVVPGDWVCKDAAGFDVVRKGEFAAEWERDNVGSAAV